MPRGAKPGERRGGRAKGVKNKNTRTVEETLARLGCDPIEGMALIALGIDAAGNPIDASIELKAKMHAELAQYVAPKRKALEVTGEGGSAINVHIHRLGNGHRPA